MQFDERYGTKRDDVITSDPAWVCLNWMCGLVERVRVRKGRTSD